MENGTRPPYTLAKTINQILVLCEKTDELMNENDTETLINPDIHALRLKIIRLSRKVLDDKEWGIRVIETMWKSCYYSVIKRIRKALLSEAQKDWTEMLIETFVKELCAISNCFPNVRATACLYIGDLRRYCWMICGHEKHRKLALLCYQKSMKLNENNGIVLNQLGLLHQETSPHRALLYFLLANNAHMPFNNAYSNIINLFEQQRKKQQEEKHDREQDPTLAIIEHCFTCFKHFYFQELSVKWMDHIISQLETRHAFHVALSISIIVATAIAMLGKGKKMELQFLSELIFRISETAIRYLEEWSVVDVEVINPRRRRASSSSSIESSTEVITNMKKARERCSPSENDVVSEDDDETSGTAIENNMRKKNEEMEHRIHVILVALLHAATSFAPHLYNDNVPSAFYCQYEEYCQRLIDYLNLLELCINDDATDGIGREKTECCLWQLADSKPWLILPGFLQQFVHSPYTPVTFEGFFRFAPRNSTKETKMKNMAKLRLAHDTEEENIRASLPLFVVPDENILLKRLDIIKTILKKNDLIVVVAEGTLRSMDDMKKDKLEARKALRWIDAFISKNDGHLRIRPALTPLKCAEELAAQAATTSSVIVTVLTLNKINDADSAAIKSITVENAEDFCTRYDKARKDLTQCH